MVVLCSGQGHRWKRQLSYPLHITTTPVAATPKQAGACFMNDRIWNCNNSKMLLCMYNNFTNYYTWYCVLHLILIVFGCFMEWSLYSCHRHLHSSGISFQQLLKVVLLKLYFAPLILLCCCIEHRHMCMKINCWGNGASHGTKTAANCHRRFSVHAIWFNSCYKWKKIIDWVCFRMQCWGQYLDLKCRK